MKNNKNININKIMILMMFLFLAGIFLQEAITISAATIYRAKHVRGTYEGYFETSKNSTTEIREAKMVIPYCDEEGNFSGTFLISDGKPGECSIEGAIDFVTGDIVIKQTKWIHQTSGLSLKTYIGTLDFLEKTIQCKEKNTDKELELMKISGVAHAFTKESVPKYWIGEYDGHYGDTVVRRGYALSITELNDDGSFTGIGVISKKKNALYQVSGSYYLSGELDFSTGYIKYKGNKWIQRANSNFGFVEMDGVINEDVITGYTQDGTVDLEATTANIPMTSFEIDQENLNVAKGESKKLSIVWNPIPTTYDKNIKWTSSNKKIATVDQGMVTGISEGTCQIIAQVGGLKADCTVMVVQNKKEAKIQNFNEIIITVYQNEAGAGKKENKYKLSKDAVIKIGNEEYKTSIDGRVKVPVISSGNIKVSKENYCTRVITAHQLMISQIVYLQKESELPVINGVWIFDVNIMNNEYPIDLLEEDQTTLTADINWGKSKYGKIELIQGAVSKTFTKNSLSMVLKDQFDVSDDIYLKATNSNGKSSIKKLKIEIAGKLPERLDDFSFSMGNSMGAALPKSWPVIGGKPVGISLDTGPIPMKVSVDNHKIYVMIGMDMNSYKWKHEYKEDGDNDKTTTKNIVSELKDIFSSDNADKKVKTFMQELEDAKKIKGSFCFSADFTIMGFAELYLDNSNEPHFMDGGVIFNPSVSYKQSGQVFLGPVPAYWEFAIKAEIKARLNLYREESANTFLPKGNMEGTLEGSIGAGVGLNDVLQTGGGIELKFKPYVDFGRKSENSLKLTTELGGYFKAKLACFEYKKTFAKKTWVLESQLAKSKKELADLYNLNNYKQQNLSYLNKKSEFRVNSPKFKSFQMADSQEDVTIFKTNTYTEANPLIGEFSDGTQIAVWVDNETGNINDVGIYVSLYDGTQWEEPFMLDDDGTFGNDPCLKIIDDVAYIAWQDAETSFSEKDDLNSIAGKMGISAARYDKEDGYFTLYDVTSENETLDMNPVICGDRDGVCLVWINNAGNSWFGTNKKNSIMVSKMDEEAVAWGENIWQEQKKLYSGINSINGYAADYTMQELNIAYCVDQDNNLETIDDLEIYLNEMRMTNNETADTAPVFSNHKLYCYSDGTIKEMSFSLEYKWKRILPENVDVGSDDYKIINNGYNQIILYIKGNGKQSGLYGIFYDREWESWGEPVLIYQGKQYISSFDGIWSQDGVWKFLLCQKEIMETDNGSDWFEKTDLVLLEKLSCSDIKVNDVIYDEEDIVPGVLTNFIIEVTNNGTSIAPYTSIELLDQDGFAILETVNNEPILPGETKEIEVSCTITNGDIGEKISVFVESEDEWDDSDNTQSVVMTYSDIAIEEMNYGIREDDNAVIYANLVNKGNCELKNVMVSLREDSADGKIVEQKTWKSLEPFTKENITFYKTYQEGKVYYLVISNIGTEDNQGNNSDYIVFLSDKDDTAGSRKLGDVNNDGSINSNDGLIVLKFASNLVTPTKEERKTADVDENGKIDAADALLILKYAAKLISEF